MIRGNWGEQRGVRAGGGTIDELRRGGRKDQGRVKLPRTKNMGKDKEQGAREARVGGEVASTVTARPCGCRAPGAWWGRSRPRTDGALPTAWRWSPGGPPGAAGLGPPPALGSTRSLGPPAAAASSSSGSSTFRTCFNA